MNSIKSQAPKADCKTATDTALVFEHARLPEAVANEPFDNWEVQ
jgi:hypothetical protein